VRPRAKCDPATRGFDNSAELRGRARGIAAARLPITMTDKPQIHYVRSLADSPTLHTTIARTFHCDVDSSRANLIGADAKEYVYVPADDRGFFFLEAVRADDGSYALVPVPADRARALFAASKAFRPSVQMAAAN
jgi:hypothetical protein